MCEKWREVFSSPTYARAERSLVALILSPDLFICAKELFLDAKLPGLGQCAARKDLLSGHQAIDGVSLLLNCTSYMTCSGP